MLEEVINVNKLTHHVSSLSRCQLYVFAAGANLISSSFWHLLSVHSRHYCGISIIISVLDHFGTTLCITAVDP